MLSAGAMASFAGGTGVLLGAFGAHALKDRLTADQLNRVWDTGVRYQLLHAVVMFAASLHLKMNPKDTHLRRAVNMWSAGTVMFSGSLYMLALGFRGPFGPMTPVGGLILIGGWVSAAMSAIANDY
jgi:uncharacterized membrane protein YgdD (TMEM256/DUF423 family)